jgi:hypothetical protein
MYACISEIGRGFFEGVCDSEDWYPLLKTLPTLPFADGSMSVQRVRWFSKQRITMRCFNILCLAISRRVENRPLAVRRRVGLCRMVNMDFGEFTFYALG